MTLFACVQAGSFEDFKQPNSGGLQRAAFELECPESQLQVTDLGIQTVGVSGCSKKAIYKYAAGAGWVNNSGGDGASEHPKNKPAP